jgi:acetylornithine deacetylase/succinyl-diaminopimelate desuccinylase-like protein
MPQDKQGEELARDILRQLVGIDTTDATGNVTVAARAMGERLQSAGLAEGDISLLGPNERKRNLVARFRGHGASKPVLLMGHLDVVDAKRQDWTTAPFALVEKDGYFYGRGTQDMKMGDAIMIATLIRMKREGCRPERDIILALTADEEGGNFNGIDWLLKNRRELVDAEFALNHDGNLMTENGRLLAFTVDATEKLYADYQVIVTDRGGHSSIPVRNNAIYRLSDGLVRLAHYEFPFELNEVTRAFYTRMSTVEQRERAADMKAILQNPPDERAISRLSQDPTDNAMMRTTCVATMLNAGHGRNALPQRAAANVNCRILPGHTSEETRQVLTKVLADPQIKVDWIGPNDQVIDHGSDRQSYPLPILSPDVFKPLETVVAEMWPGIPVVPDMSPGASDAIYTNAAGIPTYAIVGTSVERNDIRAHGQDERIRVASFNRKRPN